MGLELGFVLAALVAAGFVAMRHIRAREARMDVARVDAERADQARLRAEALRRSESMRKLLDALPDAVAVHRDGTFAYVNRRTLEVFGYDRPEDILGRSVLDFVHLEDREAVRERLREMRESRIPLDLAEERLLRRDGSIVPMDVIAVPIEFEGQPATVALARESSTRRQLQARGALADRMASVGHLAAGVAHGINNPLAYVLANTEFVLEELPRLPGGDGKALPAVDEVRRALEQVREGAIRIRDLVSDLATFSRSAERPDAPVDLHRLLDSVLALAANEIRHRARVEKEYGAVPRVLADESRLAHALMNLLVNAAHAIPEGDAEHNEIRVSTRTDPSGHAQVEVRDSGAGMAPDVVENIFDPFYTTRPLGEGTGLGLSITYQIVTAFGGTIQAESAPGRGSTFLITLPPAGAVQTGRTGPIVHEATASVLVVDDEPVILEICKRMLGRQYDVRTATSGRAALARVDSGEHFDTILCDLLMPDLTGMDLYETLRKSHPALADRIIFVTGGAFTVRAQDFLAAVPNLRLEKPFDRERLLAVVAKSLGDAEGRGIGGTR